MDVLGYQFFSMDNNGNRGREAAMCVYVLAREKLSYQVDNFARETINNDLYVSVRAVVQRSRRVWKRLLGYPSTEDIRVDRMLGGESASQHPPGARKSFRFGRACARCVFHVSSEGKSPQSGLYLLSSGSGGRIFYPLGILYL